MRRIAHISDLHFGNHDERVVTALQRSLVEDKPDLVALSGDVTHRGRVQELRRARAFLSELGVPWVAVPGNHDVPLLGLWRRFVHPLARFRHYITSDLAPFFVDHELAVLGLNTARSLALKSGRISSRQVDVIQERFGLQAGERLRVLLTHHPFVAHATRGHLGLVGGRMPALTMLAQSGARLLLTGHLHLGFISDIADHYPIVGRSMLVLQAGTATSRRFRGQPNGYNLVVVDLPRLRCTVRLFDGVEFRDAEVSEYELGPEGWLSSPLSRVAVR